MKCNNCGNKNKDGNKFCSECGAPLTATPKNSFEAEWDALEDDHAASSNYLNELEDSFSGGMDDWADKQADMIDEADSRVSGRGKRLGDQKQRRASDNGSSKAVGAKKGDNNQNSRSAKGRADDRQSGGSRGSALNKILLILLIALLAVMAVVVCIAIKGGIGTGVPKKSQYDVKHNPNDPNKYYVTVRANEGTTLVFEGTDGSKKELAVSSKRDVTFNVHKNSLLPQTYIESATVMVQPMVFQIDADGNKSIIEIPEFEIEVPEINIDFSTPESFESDNGIITIEGCLAKGQPDTVMTINGEKISTDDDGNFAYSVKRDMGEHSFDFIAQRIAHRTKRAAFNANVTRVLTADQIIVIPDTFHARSLNVEESIRVYGAIPTGARIAISSNDPDFSLKTEPEIDASGNFGFEVNLPIPAKSYKFLITATLEDGSVFERPFSVERPPVYNEYVPTVWTGNYDEMMKPVHVTDMRGFLIKGTIEEIIHDGDYLVAKFMLDGGKLIEIEYHDHYSTASKLDVGSRYTMYGYSLGTGVSPDGNLRLFIWFVQD